MTDLVCKGLHVGGIQMTIRIGRLGSIVLCAFAMAGTAGAADLRIAAPPPPAFNWSGCYVGGFVGGARSAGDASAINCSRRLVKNGSPPRTRVVGRVENHNLSADRLPGGLQVPFSRLGRRAVGADAGRGGVFRRPLGSHGGELRAGGFSG